MRPQLAPDLERVQTVRGFADLVEFRTRTASASFERAIALNPADPLPRFGLGLAQIRDGSLEQGRANLELAVGLDSSNALLRTYLGRAYFEERREALSADQYELAKELDPLDPTAYLYDAIRLQTINRPVEALRQLDRSIELNDNRAVYRSRLLLDSDRAARGASLARIYQDLDFLDTGVREATNSLTLDPTNPSAHRFLADIYGGPRRREIAAGQRAAAVADAAGPQHDPDPGRAERDQSQHRHAGRADHARLQRVHAAVPEQRSAGRGQRRARQQRDQGHRRHGLGAL